VTASLKSVHW